MKRINIFSILFGIETFILFLGIVDVSLYSMVFYSVTLIGAICMWVDSDRIPNVAVTKMTVQEMEEILGNKFRGDK